MNFRNNKITRLPSFIDKIVNHLEVLDLRENKINNIPESIRRIFPESYIKFSVSQKHGNQKKSNQNQH